MSKRDWRFRDSNKRFSNSHWRLSISDSDRFRGKCFRGRYCETVASRCYGRRREGGDDS
jgi:hypothetical protein